MTHLYVSKNDNQDFECWLIETIEDKLDCSERTPDFVVTFEKRINLFQHLAAWQQAQLNYGPIIVAYLEQADI